MEFQSTLSVRRATCAIISNRHTILFQSTLSVRRATGLAPVVQRLQLISIHALREESDTAYRSDLRDEIVISIHALREESDSTFEVGLPVQSAFQSTLSVRRAT